MGGDFPPELEAEARRAAALLTPDEIDAVRRYQSIAEPGTPRGYEDVNNYLRFGKPPRRPLDWVLSVISGMDSALKKGRLPQETTLFRALRGKPQLMSDLKLALDLDVPWTDDGFLSASTHLRLASDFFSGTRNRVVLEIIAPSSINVVFPAHATGMMFEQAEIILPRGTSLQMMSIEDRDGITFVKARVAG